MVGFGVGSESNLNGSETLGVMVGWCQYNGLIDWCVDWLIGVFFHAIPIFGVMKRIYRY